MPTDVDQLAYRARGEWVACQSAFVITTPVLCPLTVARNSKSFPMGKSCGFVPSGIKTLIEQESRFLQGSESPRMTLGCAHIPRSGGQAASPRKAAVITPRTRILCSFN